MKKRLSNDSEFRVDARLTTALDQFEATIFRKPRVADVIDINGLSSSDLRRYALMAHFDFVIGDAEHRPLFAIEYDGAGHGTQNDEKKNTIATTANLALFRISPPLENSRTQTMGFLEYLINIWFFGTKFLEMQSSGQIPRDEPFTMWSFVSADAKHIFDSEFNFLTVPFDRIGKFYKRNGLENWRMAQADVTHISLKRGNERAVFCSIPFGDSFIHGSHRLTFDNVCMGELDELYFSEAAIMDYCEGLAWQNLADNLEIAESGGRHTLVARDQFLSDVMAMREACGSVFGGGGGRDPKLLSILT
ncbi:DUF2726 domain-containing protein [Glycocaulis alkaliphilus]|nr:DUF2726 domain-containing protein [Glycocaulis alkaliphilus]